MNTIEEDAARVEAVTARLAGPEKVWVLTSVWIERKVIADPSVHATKELALAAFRSALEGSWEDIYQSQKELDTHTEEAAKELASIEAYEDGDVTWSLDERPLHRGQP